MTAPMITPMAYAPGALAKIAEKTPMIPRQFKITDLTWETGAGDVYTWKLEPVDGGEFKFKPGQFNMLYHYGVGEVPISISGDSESGVLIHTSRAVGAVTQAMQKLRPGDEIGVRGPFGSDWPVALAHGKELILLTGGIGLAPLRPVIYYALNNLNKFSKLYLLYGTRTPLDILYRRELEQWQLEGQINVAMTVDRASGHWQGNVGVVTKLLEDINIDAKNSMAMVCGPEIMMHFGNMALQKVGLNKEQIYISMERNMKCAIGHCGHCQWVPHFICKDGPVFRLDYIDNIFEVREL
jgi:NAD(P)H-flavin reductase